jgi:hypothetical protein
MLEGMKGESITQRDKRKRVERGELQHCNENPIYVFLFWELRGLSPNFHVHVSVRDLFIPRIGHIFPVAE